LLCGNPPKPQIILALEIGGVAAILVGIILSVLLSMLIKNKWIRLLPQIFLILGPTAILIGLVLLLECLREPGIGYSMLLMIIACITGYILAIYFAFATVFGRHNHENSSTDIVRESVRF
jgi:predicted permease